MHLDNVRNRLPYSARRQPKLRVHHVIWVSSSKDLVTEIGINGVSTPGDEDRVIEELSRCHMKSWRNLHEVDKLDALYSQWAGLKSQNLTATYDSFVLFQDLPMIDIVTKTPWVRNASKTTITQTRP
jgi:hypothetical protein